MSNGRDWRSYPWRQGEQEQVEKYLSQVYHPTRARITLASLLKDTDWLQPPTLEWYKLHMIVADENKWNARLISWGLNIAMRDFVAMQCELTAAEAVHHSGRYQSLEKVMPAKYISFFEPIEGQYRSAVPLFQNAGLPDSLWYKHAIMEISTRCEIAAKQMLSNGYYERGTGQVTHKGHELWSQRLTDATRTDIPYSSVIATSGKRPQSQVITPGRQKRQRMGVSSSENQPDVEVEQSLHGRKTVAHSSAEQNQEYRHIMSWLKPDSPDLRASGDDRVSSQVDTTIDGKFSIMVRFGSDDRSGENTKNAWEAYFQSALLGKRDQHPCLKSYSWTQERSGWGKFDNIAESVAQRRKTFAALKALLRKAGFRELRTYWGGIYFDPATKEPPTTKN